MNLCIKALTTELLGDYLAFFDALAFDESERWGNCYCIHFHFDTALYNAHIEQGGTKASRDYAAEMIRAGTLKGYLAYLDGEVVGWCNANDKAAYSVLRERKDLWNEAEALPTMSIVCFEVMPAMRGKGVATALLRHACNEAKAQGYAVAEAYPLCANSDNYDNYHGFKLMYKQNGFEHSEDLGDDCIMRKLL